MYSSMRYNREVTEGGTGSAVFSYKAAGGSRVNIRETIDPYAVLELDPTVNFNKIRAAFSKLIVSPLRQQRAMVSLAYYILSHDAAKCDSSPFTKIGQKFSITKQSPHVMAAVGDTKKLADYLSDNLHMLNSKDFFERTLLYLAVRAGFYDTCKSLVNLGAKLDYTQTNGSTALHAASYFNHPMVVSLLMRLGADATIRNVYGCLAADEGNSECKMEIESFADDQVSALVAKIKALGLTVKMRVITDPAGGEHVVAKEIVAHRNKADGKVRHDWTQIKATWVPAFHGTKHDCVPQIFKNGLKHAGSPGIAVRPGHIPLKQEVNGIKDWSAAIFATPSLHHAADIIYAGEVNSEKDKWRCVLKVFMRPDSFTTHESTAKTRFTSASEYRIEKQDEELIYRLASGKNVVVYSAIFVKVSALEDEVDIDMLVSTLTREMSFRARKPAKFPTLL